MEVNSNYQGKYPLGTNLRRVNKIKDICQVNKFIHKLIRCLIKYPILMILILGIAAIWIGFCLIFYLRTKINPLKRRDPAYRQLAILLGSGGHTGEMCELLKNFDFTKTAHVHFIVTGADKSSQPFVLGFILKEQPQYFEELKSKMTFHCIPRTNEVKQSYFKVTSSLLRSCWTILQLIRNELVNVTHFICNGPGTCVPFCLFFFALNKLIVCNTKLIFFQSWCRVHTLSLSGKIVRFFVDDFLVHWQELAAQHKWAKYNGRLI